MSFDLSENGAEIARAFGAALQQRLGQEDPIEPRDEVALEDALPTDANLALSLGFSGESDEEDNDDGTLIGAIVFVATPAFAEQLSTAADGEALTSYLSTALSAGVDAVATTGSLAVERQEPEAVHVDDVEAPTGEVAAYPLATGDDVLGWIVVRIGRMRDDSNGVVANAAFLANDPTSRVLGDVEMGVTAELGRCRMTIREALSLTPGAVIDLDRAAGAPVDVLVNGTVIARGEVVVIDEEFGIRISEIIGAASVQ
jgi:flagellar motor switch protein FliN/FliY